MKNDFQMRSLTSSGDKSSSKPTPSPATASTPPASPATSALPTSEAGAATSTTACFTPNFHASPRVYRSRSFGDTSPYSRQLTQSSPPFGGSELSAVDTIVEACGCENSSGDAVRPHTGRRKNSVNRESEPRGAGGHSKSMRKRASSGCDVLLKGGGGIASLASFQASLNSPREKVSGSKVAQAEERSDGILDLGRSSPMRDAASAGGEVVAEKGRDKGRGSPGDGAVTRQKRKSVCVVAPSDMKLRRSNSEKLPPGGDQAEREGAAFSRRSTVAAQPRKSMPSLSVAFEQQVEHEPDQNTEPLESQRESRKSGGSGASTSGSNGGEVITTHFENSSPKLPSPDMKKIAEYNDLPPHVSKSKNAKFHKLFKNVPVEEYPIDSYSCAFKGDILLQGMMYVSQNWICFYSKIRARGRLLEIPLEKVISITREKLALIIPNAIGIQIADQKYVFGSFMSRDNTYKLLVTLWKHSQDSANKASRLALVGGPHGEDDMTHSADVSGESDTTEDNESGVPEPVLLAETSQSSSTTSRTTDASGDAKSEPQSSKVPGLFSIRCIDCRKMFMALSKFAVKLQKVPRTNLLLAVCSILVVFLLLSAMGLTYKILLLQTRLEMSHLWTPGRQQSFREQTLDSMYTLQSQTHMATIHQLHDVLKANIQLLQQVHQSLKSLQGYGASKECPPAK